MATKLASRLFPCAALGCIAWAAGANLYGCSSDNGSRTPATSGTSGASGTGTTGTATTGSGTAGTATTGTGTTGTGTTGTGTTGTGTTGTGTTGTGTTGTAATGTGTTGTAATGTNSGTPDAGGLCSLPAAPPGLILYTGGVLAPACPTGLDYNNQSWFPYDDGTSDAGTWVHTTAMGGCGSGACAYHAAGGGFTSFGAGVGFTLNTTGSTAAPIAASAGGPFTGFQVWLKGTTTGTRQVGYAPGNNFVHIKFVTTTVRSGDEYGAYCPTQSDTWTECVLPFAGLKRDGYEAVPPVATDMFDFPNLVKIQFEFSAYTPPADSGISDVVSFDLWIDDAAFY
jgi:hypothetical protein